MGGSLIKLGLWFMVFLIVYFITSSLLYLIFPYKLWFVTSAVAFTASIFQFVKFAYEIVTGRDGEDGIDNTTTNDGDEDGIF